MQQPNDYLANLVRVLYDNKLCEHADETLLSDVVAINPETYAPKENRRSVHYLDTGSLHEKLPKLMSGEIDVSKSKRYAKQALGPAVVKTR